MIWMRKTVVLQKMATLRKTAAPLCLALLVALAGCGQSGTPLREDRGPASADKAAARGDRYDLERDERLGGHTLERHVGRSDAELRERLEHEPNISAASTWTNRETAERTIAEALHVERGRIESWMRRGRPRTNLALHYDAGQVIGRSLRRGDTHAVECTRAVLVLRADGEGGFYVLTAYPEAE
jgi:predicted small lipoprotein YifL